jgi:tRNA acetyltransferase TAN1
MLPIEAICNPGNKEVEATLTSVLAPHFETDFGVGLKYTAACKIRNNNSVSKNMILTTLGKIIKEMNPLHQLCHDEPDLVIIAEVVQKSCCFSVVKDYFKFKKYNLHEIVRKPVDDTKEDTIEESIDADKDDNVEDAETAELNENSEKTSEDQEKNEENVVEKEDGQTIDKLGNNAVDSVEKEVSETNDKVDNDNAECVKKCKETNSDTDNCKKVETIEQDVQGKQESPKQEVNDETVI